MGREIDTSRAKCDVCGKLYKPGDAIYTVADKYDETSEGKDVLISFRHWECHTPIETQMERFEEKLKRAKDILDELKGNRRG